MTKAELIEQIATQTGITKKAATESLSVVLDEIGGALAKGEKVTLPGFGVFSVSERAARVGKNPQTGAEIKIAACKVPKFKPGKALKDSVN
jgi:DNA-binding protein HU-beta